MYRLLLYLFILPFLSFFWPAREPDLKKLLLVYAKQEADQTLLTERISALEQLATENNFVLDTARIGRKFSERHIGKYEALIFIQSAEEILNFRQRNELERYLQAGGGLLQVSTLPAPETDWLWYTQLQEAGLKAQYVKSFQVDDKSQLQNWHTAFDGGLYSQINIINEKQSFKNSEFYGTLLDELIYVTSHPALDYSKATTVKIPEENRFVKKVLAENLHEPMEMAVSSQGNVFYVERKGHVNFYSAATGKVTPAGKIDVFSGNNDGLLGVALDPNFDSNQFIYLYYSPAGNIPKQHLSRFVVTNNMLNKASEKVILTVPTQREKCCHSAGSIAFDNLGNLYLSVGDNTDPKEQEGYAPTDERPGRSAFDAQRTAANTNDLRGKILRIHPEADGTYTIPDGNLFPKDGSKGKPEIYVMGARNPFRIALDPRTNYLYFGDIGPDANKASERGPAAHDEFNVAKKPGNYGWPYFVGDNKAYPKYDFATNIPGAANDPAAPVNNSPNNPGQKVLPPAQRAMIWYSYAETEEFPGFGTGGRSALAGGVYYHDPALKATGKFPEYYDRTLFVFEWMRDWVKAVKLNENGEVKSIEPFLPSVEFSSPMDMAFGKDGAMYVLEYGSGWYSDNNDAKLSRIEYVSGNRPPVAKAAASVVAGAAPLKVKFTSRGTLDYDEDPLTYAWRFTAATTVNSRQASPEYTFTKPGTYPVKLTVTDSKGQKSTASLEVIVGNSKPAVAIQVKGNTTFFWDNDKVNYRVAVTDKEDGSLAKGTIKPASVYVFLDYIAGGDNLSPVITGQQTIMRNDLNLLHPGKVLIDQSDCKSCHAPEKNSIGPSYKAIATRYKGNTDAMNRLADKIIKGGGGAWDRDFVMVAHPQFSRKATLEMVKYIMTFAEDKPETQRLAPRGEVTLAAPKGKSNEGNYRITALYTDRGAHNVKKLSANDYVILRSPRVQAENYDGFKGLKVMGTLEDGDNRYLGEINHNAYTLYQNLDLTGIDRLTYQFSSDGPGGLVEVHLDSVDGPKISSAKLVPTGSPDTWKTATFPLQPPTGKHDLYFVYRAESEDKRNLFNLNWLFFEKAEPKL